MVLGISITKNFDYRKIKNFDDKYKGEISSKNIFDDLFIDSEGGSKIVFEPCAKYFRSMYYTLYISIISSLG